MPTDSLVFASNPRTSSGHQYADIVGVQYEYPLRYRNQIQPGKRFVYYRSREGNQQPHYWGTGIVGEIRQSVDADRLVCAVLDYTEFAKAVPFRDSNGNHLEPNGAVRGYYQPGVRSITDAVFDHIVELAAATTPVAETTAGVPSAKGKQYATSEHSQLVEAISMEVVEAALAGRYPARTIRRMPHSNPGYDFEVGPSEAVERYVEAKGTVARYIDFFVTEGERQYSGKHAARYTLAVVHSINTSARTGAIEWFDGEIDNRFKLDPTQWRARLAAR